MAVLKMSKKTLEQAITTLQQKIAELDALSDRDQPLPAC
jgi:prefoldin subunit 5